MRNKSPTEIKTQYFHAMQKTFECKRKNICDLIDARLPRRNRLAGQLQSHLVDLKEVDAVDVAAHRSAAHHRKFAVAGWEQPVKESPLIELRQFLPVLLVTCQSIDQAIEPGRQ